MDFKIGDKVRCDWVMVRFYTPNIDETGKEGWRWEARIAQNMGLEPIEGYFVGIRYKQRGYAAQNTPRISYLSLDPPEPEAPYFQETGPRIKAGLIAKNAYCVPRIVPFNLIGRIETEQEDRAREQKKDAMRQMGAST